MRLSTLESVSTILNWAYSDNQAQLRVAGCNVLKIPRCGRVLSKVRVVDREHVELRVETREGLSIACDERSMLAKQKTTVDSIHFQRRCQYLAPLASLVAACSVTTVVKVWYAWLEHMVLITERNPEIEHGNVTLKSDWWPFHRSLI